MDDSHNATKENQVIVRTTNKLDFTNNDSFMDNVNEVLEMIDRESVEQDQQPQKMKGTKM